jgi:hypothetical protein
MPKVLIALAGILAACPLIVQAEMAVLERSEHLLFDLDLFFVDRALQAVQCSDRWHCVLLEKTGWW